MDSTVKPLYGHQEGAALAPIPKTPGRPGHSYHVGGRMRGLPYLFKLRLTKNVKRMIEHSRRKWNGPVQVMAGKPRRASYGLRTGAADAVWLYYGGT